MPDDPVEGNLDENGEGNSAYLIKRDFSGTITVKAPYASNYAEQEIKVSR